MPEETLVEQSNNNNNNENQQQQHDNDQSSISSSSNSRPKSFPYTIVTASSANHLCALESFLYALNDLRPDVEHFPRVVVYNIGMNRTQLPILDQLQQNGLIDDLVTFDYFKYPRFWDVAINAGEYAWKTGIVHEAAERYGGVLIWLDAGNMVTTDFLENIHHVVRRRHGFWSPRSVATMGRWTHPGMFAYYKEDPKTYARYANCNGAAIGFDADNATVRSDIIDAWYECGLDKRCIAPPGSSRANHRQDQAALSYLVYKSGFSCIQMPAKFYNLQIHRDVSCAANLLEREVQSKLHHPSSIGKLTTTKKRWSLYNSHCIPLPSIDYDKWQRSDTLKLYNHPEWRYYADQVPQHISQLMQPPTY